ncbi:hypothetical protein JOF56_010364 [Kibdelosporangium banguiense]|uniref:DUF2613 domain-containing protein n=1 Tax=Kibdelosporangium banguiense TaxID=1365924 RepID=A0ABS4U172_9PSEU|nr:hypothetical protein [Kibdelosporangium banguiense]MBP2329979.1 hypothetical protein [Kibdelosporangium banguiense]
MGTLVGAIIAVVAGLGIAGGGTYLLVDNRAPDSAIEWNNLPAPNNANGIVDYGRR